MEKLIFLILAVSILIFVLYLGATAIMTGLRLREMHQIKMKVEITILKIPVVVLIATQI